MISEDLHHPMEMFPWAVACPEGKAYPGRFRDCLHVMYSQDIKARGAHPWARGGSGCTEDEPEELHFPPELRQQQQEVLILPSTATARGAGGVLWHHVAVPSLEAAGGMCVPPSAETQESTG